MRRPSKDPSLRPVDDEENKTTFFVGLLPPRDAGVTGMPICGPDGDPITSLVVSPTDGSPTKRAITRKLSDRQRFALAALDECAASSGWPAPAEMGMPTSTVVVQLSGWREALYRKRVLDCDAKNPREELKRLRQQLQARGRIGANGELVWKA
jgi:hypothetical protein